MKNKANPNKTIPSFNHSYKYTHPHLKNPKFYTRKKRRRNIIILTSITVPIIVLSAVVIPIVILRPFAKKIDWNQNLVKETIENEESIFDLDSLNGWLRLEENYDTIRSWFANSNLIVEPKIEASGSGPFTIKPILEINGGKITAKPIVNFTIESSLDWNQVEVLDDISRIENINDADGLKVWFFDPENQPIIKTWFTYGFRAERIIVDVTGTSTFELSTAITMRAGFENLATPQPITGLTQIDHRWDPEAVKNEINQIAEIHDLATLKSWLASPSNQNTIKAWFENPVAIKSVVIEVTGTGPHVLTPKITIDTGYILFGGLTPIDDFYFETPINWDPVQVRQTINSNPLIVDRETLVAWISNPNNQPIISSWFTNSHNANISVNVLGNGPFTLEPEIVMNPGFQNTAVVEPITNISFNVTVNWIPLSQINQSIANLPEIYNAKSLSDWLAEPRNQPVMRSWFTNSKYINTLSIQATGTGPFTLTSNITLNSGYNNTASVGPIGNVVYNTNLPLSYAANWIVEEHIKSLAPNPLGSDLQAHLEERLSDPITLIQTIRKFVVSPNKVVIADIDFVVLYVEANQTYTITFAFMPQAGYVIESWPLEITFTY